MTDGPCLSMHQEQTDEPTIDLTTFAQWIDFNQPPVPMIAGMLELLGNALYREGRFTEGSEVKHIAAELRA